MKYIPEMQKNKTKKRSAKKKKQKRKTSLHAICITCRCRHLDNMDIGLIDAECQYCRGTKKCTEAELYSTRHMMKGQRGRTERTGPGCVMLSSLLWRIKTINTNKQKKKHKQEVFLNHCLLIQIIIIIYFFSWYGPLIS